MTLLVRLVLVLSLAVASGACGSGAGGEAPDGAPGGTDAGGDGADAGAGADAGDCDVPCGASCCEGGQACAYETCVPATTCQGHGECQEDSWCDPATGLCVPYGVGPFGPFDPSCTTVVVVGVFAPGVQCDWSGPPAGDAHPNHRNVLGTPMVADFDLDGDPAIPRPSIVFVSYDGTDGGTPACVGDATWRGVIRVIDGNSCAQQHSIASPAVVAAAPVAIGDLDGAPDGRPEIVAHKIGGGLVAFRYDPAAGAFVTYWETASNLGAGVCLWSGPSIHDLDDDGIPEVLMGGAVFDGRTGASRDESLGLLKVASGQIPVVVDLYGDGKPELVTGAAIYEWDAAMGKWTTVATGLGAAGLVAVGDFGTYGADPAADDRATLDGIPELAVITAGQARLQTLTGRVLLGPTTLLYFPPATNPGTGGPPTVADFDGDGRVEFAVAGRGGYNVFDPDCTGPAPDPAACASARTDGILWAMPTQDISSSVTGSSVFDFEGDGRSEVVYADECFSRVYDGRNGEILYSQFRTSCTWYENPIVADVDGDFNSEIVIPSNNNCPSITCPTIDPLFDGLRCLEDAECPGATVCAFEAPGDPHGRCRCAIDADCGGNGYVCADPIAGPSPVGKVCRAGHPGTKIQGVRVIRDSLDRWVASRPIWNQHAYSVTNVGETGQIPKTSMWARNWTEAGLNNYRQNVVGDADTRSAPDLTDEGRGFLCEAGVLHLAARLCNRGTQPVAPGVPLTFYKGDPSAGEPICTAESTVVLQPGECQDLSCDWVSPPSDRFDVVIVADDAAGVSPNTECHEGNNFAFIDGVQCAAVP